MRVRTESMPFRLSVGMCFLAGMMLFRPDAAAHNIKVFASVEGGLIKGYVYFSGGARARNVLLRAFSPTGEEVGSTRTNDQGEFSLRPRYHCDHRLVVDGGDGHRAEWLVEAVELPTSLPPAPGREKVGAAPVANAAADNDSNPPRSAGVRPATPGANTAPPAADYGDQLAAIQHQLAIMRRELFAYRHEIRVHDVLGGVGYLLGAAGIAGYFLSKRRDPPDSSSSSPDERGEA